MTLVDSFQEKRGLKMDREHTNSFSTLREIRKGPVFKQGKIRELKRVSYALQVAGPFCRVTSDPIENN